MDSTPTQPPVGFVPPPNASYRPHPHAPQKLHPPGVGPRRQPCRHPPSGFAPPHAGTHVLLLIKERNVRIIDRDTGELLRQLLLDPRRDYQPQPRK